MVSFFCFCYFFYSSRGFALASNYLGLLGDKGINDGRVRGFPHHRLDQRLRLLGGALLDAVVVDDLLAVDAGPVLVVPSLVPARHSAGEVGTGIIPVINNQQSISFL